MSDSSSTQIYYEVRELCHKDVYKHLASLRKSLLELKLASKKALLENTLHWQQKLEQAKTEKDEEWKEKVDLAEAENRRLRIVIENFTKPEESKTPHYVQLWEAQNEVDQLSRQLDKKLIHINQLQLALAEQSKAMFELEKSFVLLYCRYKRLQANNRQKQQKEKPKTEDGA